MARVICLTQESKGITYVCITRLEVDAVRVTSKGQVTIPIEIRRQAGLLPNTEVEFALDNGNVVVRKASGAPGGRGRRLLESLRGRAQTNQTTEEIMALTRGEDD